MKKTLGKFIFRVEHLPDWSVLVLAVIIYLPLTFLGYGSDSDVDSVVRIGQYFARTFDYIPSRNPGFFVHETATFFLNSLGGSFLSNLGTLLMSLVTLASFMKILRTFEMPNVKLLAGVLMIHPFYWVNSTSTMDYIWALGFLFLGFDLLLSKKISAAGIALGLAIGSRFSTVIPVFGILIYGIFTPRLSRRVIFLAGSIALAVALVCYLPAIDFTEWHPLRLFSASVGGPELWTPMLRAGRFFYKNLMFWGIPPLIWNIPILVSTVRNPLLGKEFKAWNETWLSLGIILSMELLFWAFPIEMDYLIVLIPFVLLLAGKALASRSWMLWVLFFLILVCNFVWINPARPTVPDQTTGAVYGLWLEPGYLLQDISSRLHILGIY
jgi:hypothetical protein